MGNAVQAIRAGLSQWDSSSLLSYPDSKHSADATHVRGGIGQLQARWGRGIRCSALIHPSLRKPRKRALQAVEAEADRSKQTKGSTFPPAITEQVVNLQWRRDNPLLPPRPFWV